MKKLGRLTSLLSAAAMSLTLIQTIPETASAETTTMTKAEILSNMGIGWNLGNTFDASNCTWLSNDLDYETGWQSTKTTKELIHFVHESGFSSIRIPVSWHNHMSGSSYTINSAWMSRVHEVVDYAIDEGMYVIVNIHHDNDINTSGNNFFYPSSQYKTQSLNYVQSVWKQIAAEFKDYDQHLIFETLNEPRLTGTSDEWTFSAAGANTNQKNAASIINDLNQKAVDTIRSSGGNNTNRLIMCPGYAASVEGAIYSGFVLPSDSSNMTVASIHAYTPYDFALNTSGTSSMSGLYNQLDYLFTCLDQLSSKGISSVIGEFGAVDKSNSAERVKWAEYYTKRTSERGIPLLLWDNDVYPPTDGEALGLVKRSSLTVSDSAYLSALTQYYPQECEHEWDEGVVTKKPTVAAEGVLTYTCKKCGETKTESIAKLININKATATGLNEYYLYNGGKDVIPEKPPTLTYEGETLTLNKDYEVVYKDYKNIGTATVMIVGIGRFGSTMDLHYEIVAAYPPIPGDVNSDGEVTIADLTALQKYLAGWSVTISADNADVDDSGKPDIQDLILLQKYLAGWAVTLK